MEDRVLYRKTTSCAILSTNGYSYSNVSADPRDAAYPYVNMTYFTYGPDILEKGHNYTAKFDNYTDDAIYDYDLSYDLK